MVLAIQDVLNVIVMSLVLRACSVMIAVSVRVRTTPMVTNVICVKIIIMAYQTLRAKVGINSHRLISPCVPLTQSIQRFNFSQFSQCAKLLHPTIFNSIFISFGGSEGLSLAHWKIQGYVELMVVEPLH